MRLRNPYGHSTDAVREAYENRPVSLTLRRLGDLIEPEKGLSAVAIYELLSDLFPLSDLGRARHARLVAALGIPKGTEVLAVVPPDDVERRRRAMLTPAKRRA